MNMFNTRGRRPQSALALLGMLLTTVAPVSVAAPVTWQSWSFDYAVSGDDDGLSLLNVTFQGRSVLRKLSLPVVRVFYDSNACGPYADRLGGSLSPIPWAGNATLAQRQFTLNGQLWYEIGIRDQIGSYDMYQVYYLGADGTIDAHLYSKGLQCVVNHIHYPNWRFDFDVDGPAEDQILRDTGTGFAVVPSEFDFGAPTAVNHAWRVRDATTGFHVDVLPGFPDFVIPDGSTTVPVTAYSNNTVFGRVYRLFEDEGWPYGPNTQVPFNDGESIVSADTVLWYEAYLPHSSSDGSALWHSTGVRLFVNPAGSPPPPPPPPPPPTQTQSFSSGAVSILDNGAGSPYPSTVSVPALSGTVSKVTVKIVGLTHTYPADIDLALVGPLGQAVMLMSDVGGGDDVNGVSLTFDAGAFAALPGGSIISGVFRPTNSGASDSFAAPAPASAYGTNLGVFNSLAPNGTWRLYVMDDENSDVGSIASWVLTIDTTGGTPPPPDTTPDAFAFTDVSNAPVSTLQTSNAVPITGINTAAPVSVAGGEYAIGCSGSFTTAAGTVTSDQTICVRHTSAAGYVATTNTSLTVGGVTDTFTSTTQSAPGSGGTQTFAGGTISVLDNRAGAPYPSTVAVASMVGTVTKVTIQLNGLTHTYPDDLDIALVAPSGQAVMLMSDAGGNGRLTGASLGFDSAAAGALPDTLPIAAGVYRPTNFGTTDAFPAPAPAGTYATSLAAFNGLVPNGTWSLYVVDDEGGDVGSLAGWVLTVSTTNTPPLPDSTPDAFAFTDVSNAAVGALLTSNAVLISGINTASPVSVVGGEYSIGCGGVFTTAAGTVNNNQTVCVRHTSAAAFATATNTVLTVGGVTDTFTSTTVPPPGSAGTQAFPGAAVSILDLRAAAPYPSTVDVVNMGGTISKVTVRVDGLSHTYPSDIDMALVGPGGQTVMLMSDAGAGNDVNGVSLTFDSSAASLLTTSGQIASGVFRPTNIGATDAFPAPAPGGVYGSSLTAFNGLSPNGTWRLYVLDDEGSDSGAITGWVLTVTTQ